MLRLLLIFTLLCINIIIDNNYHNNNYYVYGQVYNIPTSITLGLACDFIGKSIIQNPNPVGNCWSLLYSMQKCTVLITKATNTKLKLKLCVISKKLGAG